MRIQLPRQREIRLRVAPSVYPLDPYASIMASAMRIRKGDRVLDLGCGAGGYGLSAAIRGAGHVVLTDVHPAAVACALENAVWNGLTRVEGRIGPLFGPLRNERFHVIITTLPQLPAPRPVIAARYGGPDGLRYLRKLAVRVKKHLEPEGRLYILVTDWAYPPRVVPLLEQQGLSMRCVARVERAFQPIEYDRLAPGLFAYLDARARRGIARYRRDGKWCYLGVSLLEASTTPRAGMKKALPPKRQGA